MVCSGQSFVSRIVHGTWNTVPMLTLAARRYNGSLQPPVNNTASIPNAAAERKIAPTFVGFTTFSRTAMRLAFPHKSSIFGNALLRMAQSIPLASLKPEISDSTALDATYTGISPDTSAIRPRISLPFSESASRCSIRSDSGSYPAASARRITLGLSAMNSPRSGS